MTNVTNFQDIIGAANGDKTSVLGKFLYFSLANILVEKAALARLCEDLSIPYSGSKRISVSSSFIISIVVLQYSCIPGQSR